MNTACLPRSRLSSGENGVVWKEMEWRNREEEKGWYGASLGSAPPSDLQQGSIELSATEDLPEDRAGLLKPLRTWTPVFHVLSPSENRGARVCGIGTIDEAPQLSGAPQRAWPAVRWFSAIKRDKNSAGLSGKGKVGNPNLLQMIATRETLRRLTKL